MPRECAIAVIWKHRALLQALAVRDFQNRYAGSVAGALWALVNPLILLGIYALVFQFIFRVTVPGLSDRQPYVLFVAAALWPWLAFQEAVTRGTQSVQTQASLVKKVAFPHELLIYSTALASFSLHFSGYFLVLLVLSFLGFDVNFLALPVVLLIGIVLLLLSISVSLVLSALQVFVHDVEQVLSQGLSILFYATPVLYAMSSVPSWLANIMQWNPLVHLLEFMRASLLQAVDPNFASLSVIILTAVTLFYLARRFFLRLSPHFEDMV